MKIGAAIISFNRPRYFRKVIASVYQQNVPIHVFQDAGITKKDQESVDVCINISQRKRAIIHPVSKNIGNGKNQLRALDYMSEHYTHFLLVEDDALLGKDYLQVCLAMTRVVDVFSVNAGFRRLGSDTQKIRLTNTKDQPSVHWFAEFYTSSKWKELRSVYMQYFRFIENVRYRDRPHNKIRRLFASHGFRIPQTSQDAGRDFALFVTNQHRATMEVNRGFYLGKRGMHFNDTVYTRYGFDKAKPYEFNEDYTYYV